MYIARRGKQWATHWRVKRFPFAFNARDGYNSVKFGKWENPVSDNCGRKPFFSAARNEGHYNPIYCHAGFLICLIAVFSIAPSGCTGKSRKMNELMGSGTGTGTTVIPVAYVLMPQAGKIAAVDRTRLIVLADIFIAGSPTEAAAVQNDAALYVPSGGAINVIDTRRLRVIATIEGMDFGGKIYPHYGTRAYALSDGGANLVMLDTARHEAVFSITLPGIADGVLPLSNSTVVLCNLSGQNRIAAVDAERGMVIATINAAFSEGFAVRPDGSDYLYAASGASSAVDVISIERLSAIYRIGLPAAPSAALATGGGSPRAYFAISGMATLSIIDTERMKRIADLSCPLAASAVTVAAWR